MVVTL